MNTFYIIFIIILILINCFAYLYIIVFRLKDLNKNNANNNIYVIISILITIINGYLYIKDPKIKWYTYRKYSEILKRLISDKIINNLNDNEFLKNLEDILSEESGTWYSKGNINSTFLSGKGFNSDDEKS